MNGFDATLAMRGEFPNAKIIVLTTYKDDAQILRAMKAGAQGYLLKTTFHKELLQTIRAVHSGKKALSPEASYEIAEHATDDALSACSEELSSRNVTVEVAIFPVVTLTKLCHCRGDRHIRK